MKYPSVENKINEVSDRMCNACPQCWDGECRAFQMVHEAREKAQRMAHPWASCQIRDPLRTMGEPVQEYVVAFRDTLDTSGEMFTTVIRASSGQGATMGLERTHNQILVPDRPIAVVMVEGLAE